MQKVENPHYMSTDKTSNKGYLTNEVSKHNRQLHVSHIGTDTNILLLLPNGRFLVVCGPHWIPLDKLCWSFVTQLHIYSQLNGSQLATTPLCIQAQALYITHCRALDVLMSKLLSR